MYNRATAILSLIQHPQTSLQWPRQHQMTWRTIYDLWLAYVCIDLTLTINHLELEDGYCQLFLSILNPLNNKSGDEENRVSI